MAPKISQCPWLRLRSLLILAALNVISTSLNAQEEVIYKGNVKTANEEALPGAILLVYDSSNNQSIKRTALTDSNGEWKISLPGDRPFILEVRYLGFASKRLAITPSGSAEYLSITLEEEAKTLNDVVINAYKNAIRQSGDTTIYDIHKFLTGYEYNLKEVLDKLPGLTVSDDGDILYQGERINYLLVEGKDVLGNQHKLAGELFLAEDLVAINIIENYKTGGNRLSNKRTEDVALDIQLTDEALNQWQVQAEAGAGYDKRLQARADAFNIRNRLSSTVFGRWNNTAGTILSLGDYLSVQPSVRRTLEQSEGTKSITPEEFNFPQALTNNSDGLTAANVLFEPSEKHRSKVIFLYGSLNRDAASMLNRQYQNTETTFNALETVNYRNSLVRPTFTHEWQPSQNTIVEIEIPLSFIGFENLNQADGTFNEQPTASLNDDTRETFEALPAIYFTRRFSEQWFNTFSFSHLTANINRTLNLSDVDSLFDTSLLNVNQSTNENRNLSTFYNRLEYQVRDSSTIGMELQLSLNNFDLVSFSEQEEPLNWKFRGDRNMSNLAFFFQAQTERYSLNTNITGKLAETRINNVAFSQAMYGAVLEGIRDFDIKNSLSLRLSISQEPYKIEYLNSEVLAEDNRTLVTSRLNPNQVLTKQTISLSYVRFKFQSASQLFLNFGLTRNLNSPYQDVEVRDNFTVVSWLESEKEEVISFKGIYNAPLVVKKFRPFVNGFLNNSTIVTPSGTEIKVNQFRYSLGTRTQFYGLFNYELLFSSQVNGNGSTANRFKVNTYTFEHTLKTKNIRAGYSISRKEFLTSSDRVEGLWELNASIDVHLKKYFTLFAIGNDLLNLEGAGVVQRDFEVTFFEERSYTRFPGYILVGIRYVL